MHARRSPGAGTDGPPRIGPAVPRLSAGVIPFRATPSGACEIFWVRRSKVLRFMGGWHAFPGGRLSGEDAAVPVRGAVDGHAAYLSSGRPAAHPACAVRELFEEAGILPLAGPLPDSADLDRARDRLLENDLDFSAWLASRGLALDASRLLYAGRWVTPPLSSIRFDASFFLLEWPADCPRQPSVIPGELVSGEWVTAEDALSQWVAGEVKLAQPTLETLRVLAKHGPEGRKLLWQSQAHQPNSPHAIEFRPLIRVIPVEARTLPPATHTNSLLLGGKDVILVDPGCPGEGELRRLREVVDGELRRTGGELRGIWLTHHHDDHVAGAETMRRHFGVPVSCHPATEARLGDRGIRIEGSIDDGDVAELAGDPALQVRVVHTPGHASGHLCFFEERTRTLLAGDMVSGYSTVVINPPDGNMVQYLDSLRTLADLDPAVILPSHGTMISEPLEALRKTRLHRLEREECVYRAWRRGERELEALVDSAYESLNPAARFLAGRQVLAHLEGLSSTGRIGALPGPIRAALGRE